MTPLRLKKINGVPPKAAKIEGANQKYGLDMNWRGVSRSPVVGTDEFTFTLDDGILDAVEGDRELLQRAKRPHIEAGRHRPWQY